MSVIAYIRVSTEKQNLANQRHELEKFTSKNNIKVDKWLEETISSRQSLEKRALGHILKKMKRGDILITCEISRLGRNLLEIMEILQTCLKKNCHVWTIKENYRLGSDIQSKVLAFAFGLSAEIERQLISQRTKEALARVKASGKKLGRPVGFRNMKRKLDGKEKQIKHLLDNHTPKIKIAQILGVERCLIYTFIRANHWEQYIEKRRRI